MSDTLPPLITALLDPARYPHPVERVDLVQTHGAWVLLAGDFAYKIKKPVRFAFMDFSLPFGGYKQSGIGREGGPEGLEEFFETKTVHFPGPAV